MKPSEQLPAPRPEAPFNALLRRRDMPALLALAILTALLLPRQSPFPYHYAIGQPWSYKTLYAPFDFDVLRPEAEVKTSIEQLKAERPPCLILREDVAQKQKKAFDKLLSDRLEVSGNNIQFEDLNNNPESYRNFGKSMLDILYNTGILPSGDPTLSTMSRTTPVVVADGKNVRNDTLGRLFTLKTAEEFLNDTLPYCSLRQPELLLPLLQKTLIPNLVYSDSLTEAVLKQRIAAVASTGVTLHKGESIVGYNELVSAEIAQALQSLERHYDQPAEIPALLGLGILSLLAYALFGLFVFGDPEAPVFSTQQRIFLLGSMPVLFALLYLLLRFGTAVPLLFPLFALPLTLQLLDYRRAAWAVWAVVVLLCAVSLDWGTGWLMIQTGGFLAAQWVRAWNHHWPGRLRATAVAVAAQLTAFAGAGMAGKLPEAVWNADTVLLLLGAGGLSLLAIPASDGLSRILKRQT